MVSSGRRHHHQVHGAELDCQERRCQPGQQQQDAAPDHRHVEQDAQAQEQDGQDRPAGVSLSQGHDQGQALQDHDGDGDVPGMLCPRRSWIFVVQIIWFLL